MTKVTENEFGQRYIFIGGVPRSGTTLLQNMLDSHPDILGLPEFIHLPEIMALRKNMRHSATHGMISDICSLDDIDTRIRKLIRSGESEWKSLVPKSIIPFLESWASNQ